MHLKSAECYAPSPLTALLSSSSISLPFPVIIQSALSERLSLYQYVHVYNLLILIRMGLSLELSHPSFPAPTSPPLLVRQSVTLHKINKSMLFMISAITAPGEKSCLCRYIRGSLYWT